MKYARGNKVRVIYSRPENEHEYSSEKYLGQVFTVINRVYYDDRVYVRLENDKTIYFYFDEIELVEEEL